MTYIITDTAAIASGSRARGNRTTTDSGDTRSLRTGSKAKNWIIGASLFAAFSAAASAQSVDPGNHRQELKRAPLTGTNMEVVISVVEYKPGETLERHIHHGEEAFYVLQPATLQTPDGKEIKFPAGAAAVNARDIPHGGIKVTGEAPFRFVAVHVVDKGAPLYDAPK